MIDLIDYENREDMRRVTEMMDSGLKDITKNKGSHGSATYKFTMEKNTPKVNEYDEDFVYTISFSSVSKVSVMVTNQQVFGGESFPLTYFSTCLTFSNNQTGMSELGGENGVMTGVGNPDTTVFSGATVYGTIGRILLDYFKTTPESVCQGLDFSTAGPHLVKPYIILSQLASKKADLVWVNPVRFHGQGHENFNLISNKLVLKIQNIIKGK